MRLTGFSLIVERDPLRSFARAIGDDRAVCLDVEAARAAGYPDLLAPPTYLFSLELHRPRRYAALEQLGASLSAALHANQSISYDRLCFAGDHLDFELQITGYSEKRGGALGFLERTTHVVRQGQPVATLTNVLAVRWDRAA
jgi:acyl dehydratase